MASGDIHPAYATPTSGSGGPESLATSSTWTAGYEWIKVDVAGMTVIPRDVRHQGQVTVGTTPTINTEIRIYLIASEDGSTWPDVFDGTPSAETITSEGVRDGFAKLAAVMRVDSTTSNRAYPYSFSAEQVFGGSLPDSYMMFVTHNSGVNLNSTSGNHTYIYAPQYDHLEA